MDGVLSEKTQNWCEKNTWLYTTEGFSEFDLISITTDISKTTCSCVYVMAHY